DVCSSDLAHGKIAAAIKTFRVQSAKVTNTGHSHRDQAVKKFVHTLTAQGNLTTDWHAFTQLERRDRRFRFGDDRLLTSDQFHFFCSRGDLFLVLATFAHTHVDHDLFDTWNFHVVRIVELFPHRDRKSGV